ncbi:MAG: hypothetical protein JST00_36345 [Deltaproteobacteria bacterium]|nr:hypothetical protein [Deltaproteobacteria bacterium]
MNGMEETAVRRTRSLALATALSLAGCTPQRGTPTAAEASSSSPPRAATSTSPPPSDAAASSSAVVVAPASAASTAPDAGPPCIPVGPFAAALREGASLDYDVDDDVDPHGTEPGRVRTRSTITFRVTGVDCEGGAVVASGEWSGEGAASLPAGLPRQWRVASGRIHESEETHFAESDLSRAKGPLCRTSTDRGPYGKTLRRVCIDGRGLTSLREENLHGPRVVVVTRRAAR